MTPTLGRERVEGKRGGEYPDMASPLSTERAARNESVFRNANERIEQHLDDLSLLDGRSPFLCECDDPLCAQPVRLTAAEYEAIRAHSRRFVLAAGHSAGDAAVVERHDGYFVVEKRGAEGSLAEAFDPRMAGS
jgi:hypothetical protein